MTRCSTLWLLAALGQGCGGGGDLCAAQSPCSADVAYTRAEIQTCQAAVAAASSDAGATKCALQGKDYELCLRSKRVCGSDNKTDISLTQAACGAEISAYAACLNR